MTPVDKSDLVQHLFLRFYKLNTLKQFCFFLFTANLTSSIVGGNFRNFDPNSNKKILGNITSNVFGSCARFSSKNGKVGYTHSGQIFEEEGA